MISVALRLPAPDIDALLQGRTIVAIVNQFITANRTFALCPTDESNILLPVEQYYRSNFLNVAKNSFTQFKNSGALIQPQQINLFPNNEQLQLPLLNHQIALVKAWAKCEQCQNINDPKSLAALSRLTIWTQEALQEILNKKQNIFLVYLRVYQLSTSIEVTVKSNSLFIPLPQPVNVSDTQPVLSNSIFTKRKKQLENLEPPLHPELEELQSALLQIVETNPAAQQLENQIKIFLGCNTEQTTKPLDSDLGWISRIAEVGNSSDGFTFEKLVRRALLKLGFTGSHLNPDASGGAGGMDFYAEKPYPIVGECKATKTEKVSDGTPAQLLKIGVNHLTKEQYERTIKLIVAAGELNDFALRTAREHEMNVISPETLQKLVELQSHYKNSVNLIELKECLQQKPYGLADDKVNEYIKKIEESIEMRSHIIQIVKHYLQNSEYERAGVEALHAIYTVSHASKKLSSQELYHILIELSSPLTGYLGRIKGEDWKTDRFYYLRDLD